MCMGLGGKEVVDGRLLRFQNKTIRGELFLEVPVKIDITRYVLMFDFFFCVQCTPEISFFSRYMCKYSLYVHSPMQGRLTSCDASWLMLLTPRLRKDSQMN